MESLTQTFSLKKSKIKTIVAFGQTGAGKSSLLNLLSDSEEFKVGHDIVSQTAMSQRVVRCWRGKKQTEVAFFDTQGFGDNNGKIVPLSKFLSDFEGGINVALFLIPIVDTKLSQVALDSLRFLFLIFGKKHLNSHLFLVLTQIERLDSSIRDATIKKYEEQALQMFNQTELAIGSAQMVVYEQNKIDQFCNKIFDALMKTENLQPELGEKIEEIIQQNPNIGVDQALLIASTSNSDLNDYLKKVASDLEDKVQLYEKRMKDLEEMGIKDKITAENLQKAIERANENAMIMEKAFQELKNERQMMQVQQQQPTDGLGYAFKILYDVGDGLNPFSRTSIWNRKTE